ncbi:MAG: ABC transporter substrate-binding protein [Chloroflexota bacterium]
MTRTDSVVVGTLVVLLALVAGLIGVPAILPSLTPGASPAPSGEPAPDALRPYVEGAMGAAVSVSPFTARTQVDRDLVALIFSGLVRNGPGGTIVADLAESWSVDDEGRTWTVVLRDDARWHDGEPVTSEDVAFTIRTLQDPAYQGPASTSWREVTVGTPTADVVTFALATPLGGFLQALTQPIAPAHILAEVPVALLPDHPFGRQPVGTGPFSLVELDQTSASLIPAVTLDLVPDGSPDPSARPTDSLATPGATRRPERPLPYLAEIDFRFYTDPALLAKDFRSGDLDAVSGISPELAAELGTTTGSRLLRYPGSTLTAVVLNLRPGHREFADPRVRTALLQAIDRADIIGSAYAGAAAAAAGPIAPSSPLYDAAADPPVGFDPDAAQAGLKAAGWSRKDDGWYLPDAKEPLSIEVISPTVATNRSLFDAAAAVVEDWTAIGLTATHEALPPGVFATDRLSTGDFSVAVVDVIIGLDPDLYPLLASSQTLTGGSNIAGLQDPALDALLIAARAPGTDDQRKAAYSALQKQLATGRYLLPVAFAHEVVVAHDTLQGPAIRQVTDPSDRFWDVLTWRLAVDR